LKRELINVLRLDRSLLKAHSNIIVKKRPDSIVELTKVYHPGILRRSILKCNFGTQKDCESELDNVNTVRKIT
jgi:hypothetical protein